VRTAPTPQPVADLAATQKGNDVVLTFTLPKQTINQRPLEQPVTIMIYRDFEPSSANAAQNRPAMPSNPTLLATIPAAMVNNYAVQGRVRYSDSLRAEDFAKDSGMLAIYAVRTSVSKKAASPNSNVADVRVEPAADPITDLKAEVTRTGVVLSWSAPGKTFLPAAAVIVSYRIYRGETTRENSNAPPTLTKIGETESPPFADTQAQFGENYVYSVRSVAQNAGENVESADSNLLAITPKDVFPPAAPQGLVAAAVPAQGDTPAHLELSWEISPEPDVAGYNIYRTDQPGQAGVRLNTELLLTPAFRDMNVQPGRVYYYSVTAVDRAGNESSQSAVVSGTVATESQKTQ